MPADLERIHAKMCRQDADVVKIAVRAQSPLDNLRVLRLLRNRPNRPWPSASATPACRRRLLGAKYGAPWTYAAFNKERGIAPGLPSYQELKQVYHYPRITPEPWCIGIVGDPVAHSLSPLIHNTAFAELGVKLVYVPFRVPRTDLQAFLEALETIPVAGLQRHHPAQGSRRRPGLEERPRPWKRPGRPTPWCAASTASPPSTPITWASLPR